MRAEGEARLADRGLGVCMLLIGEKLADARRVLDPGRGLADLLLLALCGGGLRLANLLARRGALQQGNLRLNGGDACSESIKLGARDSVGSLRGHGR